MNEASGDALDAHGGIDFTDNGSVGSGTGIVSGARDFESAVSQWFSHADSASLSTGDIDFSFEVWVNFESVVGTNTFIRKWDGSGTEYIFWFDGGNFVSNRLLLAVRSGGGTITYVAETTYGVPSTGVWIQVCAGHSATADEIWITANAGTPLTAAHSSGVSDTGGAVAIGQDGAGHETLDGLLDNVRFWKRDIRSDVSWLYNSGNGRSYADIVAEATPPATRRFLLVRR